MKKLSAGKKKVFIPFLLVTFLNAMTYEDAERIEKKDGLLKALGSYKSLAKQNNTEAMFRLAQVYSSGKTIQRSLPKTFKLLKKASDLNHHKSTYYLGKLYLSKKSPYYNLTDAYNTFVKSANAGYAPAENMIGQFFANSVVVEKDYKLAVKYFEKASKQGHIDAQCNLSFMYASGKGVFPNFGRAHQFAKKGIELGNKKCIKVWEDYNLAKYSEDKGWKFKFYTKP